MSDSNHDYDTYEQYSNNHGVYEKIQGNSGDEYNSFPIYVLGEQTENIHSITMDCLRLKKYLMDFHSIEKCKKQNCCQYINHWLNKRVRDVYGSKKSIFEIYIKYMKHNNNEIMNLCVPEINYMDLDKYNKIVQLYKAYNVCKYYISNYHKSRSCSYAKYCANAYKNIMTVYIKIDDAKFCKKLKELKDFLEGNEPPQTIKCDSSFSALFNYPHDCTKLLQESEEIKASKELSKEGLELPGAPRGSSEEQRPGIAEVGPPGLSELGVREPVVGETEGGIVTEETRTLSDTPAGDNVISAESPSAKTSTPVGTIIGTSLGFVLPLITMYRFTPLGNWVNTRVLGREKLMDNMKKNELEFLLNSTQTQDMNSGDTIYRIKYNSALSE